MKAAEFVTETTVSGAVATASAPIGGVIRRSQPVYANAKYKKPKKKRDYHAK